MTGHESGCREMHGLLGRPTLTIDRHTGDFKRPAGGNSGAARDVARLFVDLAHAAPDDVFDLARLDAHFRDQPIQQLRCEINRMNCGKTTVPPADGGAGGADNDGSSHVDLLIESFRQHRQRISAMIRRPP